MSRSFRPMHGEPEKSADKALASIQRMLTRRDHSEAEIQRKLQLRYTPEAIEQALEKARARGWIRTPGDLSMVLSEQLHQRKKSHRYIEGYLRAKGLPVPPVDREREVEKCVQLLGDRFDEKKNFSDAERVEATKFLHYKGFDYRTIKEALDK